jgi:DNA polymerase V
MHSIYNSQNFIVFRPFEEIPVLEKETIFFSNSINAGFPSPAQDFLEDNIDFNKYLIKHPSSTFILKVNGDSMVGANIHHNSIIIVDTSLKPKHSDVAVCFIDGEFTLKYYTVNKSKIVLMPANDKYKPIEILEGSELSVWGIVTFVINKPKCMP